MKKDILDQPVVKKVWKINKKFPYLHKYTLTTTIKCLIVNKFISEKCRFVEEK